MDAIQKWIEESKKLIKTENSKVNAK